MSTMRMAPVPVNTTATTTPHGKTTMGTPSRAHTTVATARPATVSPVALAAIDSASNATTPTRESAAQSHSQHQHQHQHPIRWRPTQAQLRWAQFHAAQRAQRTRESVQRQYPHHNHNNSHQHEHEHEQSSNGNSNSNNNNNGSNINPLAGSEVAYNRRCSQIARDGYRHAVTIEDEGNDDDATSVVNDPSQTARVTSTSATTPATDAVDAIFGHATPASNRRRRRRRQQYDSSSSRHHNNHSRFEAAFRALLASVQAATPSRPEILVATKAWTRPDDGPLHDVDYSDLKWGGLKQQKRSTTQTKHQPHPQQQHPSPLPQFSDAMRTHLTHVAQRYLNTSEEEEDGTARPAAVLTTVDVAAFVEQFERHWAESSVRNGRPGDPTTAEQSDTLEYETVWNFVEQFEREHARSATMEKQQLATTKTTADGTGGIVQRFVAQMEEAMAQNSEQLVSADGTLHKPTFARLVQRYLGQFKPYQSGPIPTHPEATNRGTLEEKWWRDETADGCSGENDSMDGSLAQHFLEQMEQDDELGTIVGSDGTLNVPVFVKLVHRYLPAPPPPLSSGATDPIVQPAPTASSKTSTASQHNVVLDGADETSRHQTLLGRGIHSVRSQMTNPSLLSDSVSRKVGQLFHSLHNNHPTTDDATTAVIIDKDDVHDDAPPENRSTAGLQEYSAFCQAQSERRRQKPIPDDTSSMSSFRVLPAGIRNVVQGVRDKLGHSRMQHHDTEDGKSANEDSEHKEELARRMDQLDDGSYSASSIGGRRQGDSQSGTSSFSPDNVRNLQSALLNGNGPSDESFLGMDESVVNGGNVESVGMSAQRVESLMLSPTLLTKRHQQAIRAVESRKWDQIQYLLSANPWLAEMADVNTNQYVLHKLAFYGAGQLGIDPTTSEVIGIRCPPAPDQINGDLVRMFPSSVHKFDQDGNLPLHMAAASANVSMIRLLGDRFPSGASVRNEDGMLPLHLILLACASPLVTRMSVVEIVKNVTDYFPGALAIADNEGNLPIHTAASVLSGAHGVDIIEYLLEEADRQVRGPLCLQFRNESNDEYEDESIVTEETMSTVTRGRDDTSNCLVVRNVLGNTPLALAIYSMAGWEVIEMLSSGDADAIPTVYDAEGNNALHLLLSHRYQDPTAAMVIVKADPEAVALRNDDGVLPIEIACMEGLPKDVILELVLVDLPLVLDGQGRGKGVKGIGVNWWYIACECDDHYVEIVAEIVAICSFSQLRTICNIDNGSDTLLARATPKCKSLLAGALRFAGRFEFIDSEPIYSDGSIGVTAFDAFDFGTHLYPAEDGVKVILQCFSNEASFRSETSILQKLELNLEYFEEVVTISVAEEESLPRPITGTTCCFVSTEQPDLTLNGVVRGMLGNQECQHDAEIRNRYTVKVFSVLRLVAKGIRNLHAQGFVHGNICVENCGKYGGAWKLSDVLGSQPIGEVFEPSRFSVSAPPEAIQSHGDKKDSFRRDLVCQPSLDSWAYGKLAYEVLVGDTLFDIDAATAFENDHASLSSLRCWDDVCLRAVKQTLQGVGINQTGIALVTQCLSPDEEFRPSMEDVLKHPLWSELRRQSKTTTQEERMNK